jgi:hypothetical protein
MFKNKYILQYNIAIYFPTKIFRGLGFYKSV